MADIDTQKAAIKLLDRRAIDALAARADESPRRRHNLNLHPLLSDPIQRFLNAGEPGSYVRPHRHVAERWEMFAVLRGAIALWVFAPDGAIAERATLAADGGGVVEIPGGVWHSIAFMAPGSVALEIKPGPYVADTDKEFAPWSPREGEAAAARFLDWLAAAPLGAVWRG